MGVLDPRRSLLVFLASWILHSVESHYLATAPGYPSSYATLYSGHYGIAHQQLWPEQTLGLVQVQPPTFHGKLFQKSLFPIWAQNVGLATGDPSVYAPSAAVVSAYPFATSPTAFHTALAYPSSLHALALPSSTSPPAEGSYSAAQTSPAMTAIGTASPMGPATATGTQEMALPTLSEVAPTMAVDDKAAAAFAAPAVAAPAFVAPAFAAPAVAAPAFAAPAVETPAVAAPAVAAPAVAAPAFAAPAVAAPAFAAPSVAAPTFAAPAVAAPAEDSNDSAASVATTTAGAPEATTGGPSQDLEPSVDSGASNNLPMFLGAPNGQSPVSVAIPESDGKKVVVYQFPNLLEGLVQRFQNYFSTYNHITTTSISNAVANANANSSSNSDSSSTSNSNSKSNSESDSKSDSKSESDSKSDSGSGSNSGSASLSGSSSPSGSQGGPATPEVRPNVPEQSGQNVAAPAHGTLASAAPHPSQPTAGVPATTHHPQNSPPQAPSGGGYPHRQQHRQQFTIDPPQKAYSYELYITKSTTPAPFQGYSYDRPRVPFDPYKHLRGRHQQSYFAPRWQVQQSNYRNGHRPVNEHGNSQRFEGSHYPRY